MYIVLISALHINYAAISEWVDIIIELGQYRGCGLFSIPDNECLDKKQEYLISLSSLVSSENITIEFQQDTAWLFIVDNDSKYSPF